ncbi:hypothetical protein RND81_13G106400 [Saponaria officinalis]|uniref:Uncharacterized protein n=1 Tax=Saponaria officinalis TaxID=3572 RepID=A0AAW1GW30_SAPOF
MWFCCLLKLMLSPIKVFAGEVTLPHKEIGCLFVILMLHRGSPRRLPLLF